MSKYQHIAALLLRLATAANFLSAVADRFGFWGKPGDPGVSWGNWENFVLYNQQVNSFLPPSFALFLGTTATVLEIILPVMLILGWKTRLAALGSAILTLGFALAMTYSFGIKAPLNYAVFVDFTSAFLLATIGYHRWSIDALSAGNSSSKEKILI